MNNFPVDTGRKLNVHKTSRTSSERLIYVKFTSCVYWVMNIDILIGTDFCHTFFIDEIIRGKSNEPLALSSHFGWVLSRNYKVNKKQKSKNTRTFFVENESFCKYEPFNDDSLEMKIVFHTFIRTIWKKFLTRKMILIFTSEIYVLIEKVTKLNYPVKRIMNRYR